MRKHKDETPETKVAQSLGMDISDPMMELFVKTAKKTGRPRKEVDFDVLAFLCGLQLKMTEMSVILGVSEDTIERRVMEEYGFGFAEFFRQKRGMGTFSLRRRQYLSAMSGSDTMMIWLDKQWLGGRDKHELTGANGSPLIPDQDPYKRLAEILSKPGFRDKFRTVIEEIVHKKRSRRSR